MSSFAERKEISISKSGVERSRATINKNEGTRAQRSAGRKRARTEARSGLATAAPAATGSPTMASILARSRPILATATFRTPRLHRAGARPVQGVLSRLITRTRISSDREGCRVSVAQLDCARLYSDDDFEPSQRQPSVQFALCGAARCASPVDTQVRFSRNSCGVNTIHSKLRNNRSRSKHGDRLSAAATKPISARRSECRSRKTLMPSFHRR